MPARDLVERIARTRRPVGRAVGRPEGSGGGVVDLPWGWATVRVGAPHLEADSRVVVVGAGAPWPQVVAAADRILGGAGMAGRRVEVWRAGPGPGAPAADGVPGRALTPTADAPARRMEVVMVLAADRPAPTDLAAAGARVAAAGGRAEVRVVEDGRLVQHLAIVEGRVASLCHLDRVGSLGEVEGVQTVPDQRGRGLGSAVVVAAAHRARADGVRTVWLRTDADGAPRRMYGRLGFEAVGVVTTWSWTALT